MEKKVTAILVENFNEKYADKIGDKGVYCTTNAGVECALAAVYVNYLKSQGVSFEIDEEEGAMEEKIRKSLLRYKTKAKQDN